MAFNAGTEAFGYRIVAACTGLTFMLIFAGAILAYPATAGQRMLGLAVGLPALFVANIARLVGLGWVGLHARNDFAAAHEYWAQGLLIAVVGVAWLAWVWFVADERLRTTTRTGRRTSALVSDTYSRLRSTVAPAAGFVGVFGVLGLVGLTLGGVAAWGAVVRAPVVHAAPLFDMTLPNRLPASELLESYRFHYAGLAAVLALLMISPPLSWGNRVIETLFLGLPLVYLIDVAFGLLSLALFEAPAALAPITTTPGRIVLSITSLMMLALHIAIPVILWHRWGSSNSTAADGDEMSTV